MLPVDGSALLPTAGGASARLVADKVAGVGPANTLTAPPAGQLTDASLFTDVAVQNMERPRGLREGRDHGH